MAKPIEACHAAVGIRIRQIRETLGLQQSELAKRVGLSRAAIANTEIGRQRLLLDGIERYARALGTTPKQPCLSGSHPQSVGVMTDDRG
jgi:transcriptional regulator with XRE-family HTH domain